MTLRPALAAALAAAALPVHAAEKAPAPPAAEPTTSVFLKRPLPASTPAACRPVPVDDRTAKVSLVAPGAKVCPVAVVGGQAVTVEDLMDAVAPSHARREPGGAGKPAGMDYGPALDRLVEVRLIELEAREMGLDASPDLRRELAKFEGTLQREILEREVTKGIRPEALEVEGAYRDRVRVWKVSSVLLATEADAERYEGARAAGKGFDEIAKSLVGTKAVKGAPVTESILARNALPQVAKALKDAKAGDAVGPVKVPGGFAVMKVEQVSYPEDPELRAAMEGESVERQRRAAMRRYYESLVKRYATVDEALLRALDWEAPKPGLEKLRKDGRAVARIQGEKPLTVADLTAALEEKFFHGLETPIKEHRVNQEKVKAFETLLGTRLMAKDALRKKVADRADYRRAVEQKRRALLFALFVETALLPEVKVTEEDGLRYYEQHKGEFTSPQMYKLEGIAFTGTPQAQAAVSKLQGGADFPWMRANADGRIPPQAQSLVLDGSTVSVNALPAGLGKVLAGAKAGDYRLYEASRSESYAIRVVESTPPGVTPYAEARQAIGNKLFAEKLAAAIREHARKVREARPVEVLIVRIGS